MIRLPYLFDDVNDNENDNTTINNNVNNNDHNQQQHSLDSLNCQQLHQEGLMLQNASDLHQFNSMFQNNNDDNHLLFPDPTATISSLNDDYSPIQVLQNTRNVGLNSSATQSHLFNMGVSLHINNNRNRDNMEQSQITNNNNDDDDDDDDKIKSPTTISSSYLQQQNPTLAQLLAAGTNNTKEVSLNPTSVTQNQQINGIIVDKHQQQHVYPSVTTTNLPNLVNQKPPVYTKWTEKEDELLREAVQIYGPHKWSLIATHVPNRTPMQCSARWVGALNPSILKGRWTTQEDNALRDAVNQYMMNSVDSQGNPQPIPWNKVSKCIPARTGAQCQARWTEALDPRIKKGKWSPEEDEILKEGVRLYGRCWIRIAEMIAGRTQRQCRTRWLQVKNKQFKKKNNDSSNNNNNNKSNNNGPTAIIRTSSNKSDNNKNNANSNNSRNNDNNSNDQKIILTPPNTTPSTPSQSIKNVILSSSRSSSVSSSLASSPVSSSSPSSFSPTSNIQGVIMRSSPTNIHHSNNASNANNMTVQQHRQQQLLMINNRITSNSQTPRIVNEQLCNFIYPYHQINNHHQYNQLCNYSNNQISFY